MLFLSVLLSQELRLMVKGLVGGFSALALPWVSRSQKVLQL